jgi:hypothetical protein
MSTDLDKYLPYADHPTPRPQEGTWTLQAPDGRTFTGDSPIRCIHAEITERVPPQVALGRIARSMNEEPDEAPDEPVVAVTQADVTAAREIILECTGKAVLSGGGHAKREDRGWVYRRLCQAATLLLGDVAAPPPAPAALTDAVVKAAREWCSERTLKDWDEAELAKAVIRLEGDWPGCPECDFQCDEPCVPATVDEQLATVDHHIAQLVHEGALHPPSDYKPPDGWKPMHWRAKRRVHAEGPTP